MTDDTVWNDKLGYEMDVDKNERMDKAVRKYQGKNKLAKDMDEEEDESCRYSVFDSVFFDAFEAAKDIYIEDGEKLDKVIDEYVAWLKKCKGKEKELIEMARADEEEDEEEGDEAHKEKEDEDEDETKDQD
jgi:hypothetical protein